MTSFSGNLCVKFVPRRFEEDEYTKTVLLCLYNIILNTHVHGYGTLHYLTRWCLKDPQAINQRCVYICPKPGLTVSNTIVNIIGIYSLWLI